MGFACSQLKIFFQDLRSYAAGSLLGVYSCPRGFQNFRGNVRCQNGDVGQTVLCRLPNRHGQRVGLFSGRTAGRPDGEGTGAARPSPVFEEGTDNAAQTDKVRRFPEERREIGGDGIDHRHQFILAFLGGHVTVVFGERPVSAGAEPFSQAGFDQFLLAVVQINAALFVNQTADFFEIAVLQFKCAHGHTIARFSDTLLQWTTILLAPATTGPGRSLPAGPFCRSGIHSELDLHLFRFSIFYSAKQRNT